MTLITRLLALGLTCGALAVGAPSTAERSRSIDPLDQRISIRSTTASGADVDPVFHARWSGQERAAAIVTPRGANDVGRTTRFAVASPAPRVVRPGASSYCLQQAYAVHPAAPTAGDTTASAGYASVLVVRRDGEVVLRDRQAAAYEMSTEVEARDRIRPPDFRFSAGDRVTWRLSGELSGPIERFASRATVTASCGGASR